MNGTPQNILILHIAGLEETVLALPALSSLRNHLTKARITVVSSIAGAELIRLTGCVDRVLAVGRFHRAELFGPQAFYRSAGALRELRDSAYDLAIEFQSGSESAIILSASKPRERLRPGSSVTGGVGALIERVSDLLANRPQIHRHKAHEYLKFLEQLGVRPIESEPRLKTARESDEAIDRMLQKHGAKMGDLLVGIHPGAGSAGQRWPTERFASIASRLINNYDARVIVFSGPHERAIARRIAKALPAKSSIILRLPKLVDFISATARLSLLIANHNGPAHIAAAVGTPVVVASVSAGPSDHDILGSRVEHVRAPHIEMVPEEEIYEAACRLLKVNRAKFLGER